jgi:hypothetical protein
VPATPLAGPGDTQHRAAKQQAFSGFHEQERMLADRPRMAFYAEAIRRHIRKRPTGDLLSVEDGV